MLFRSQQLIEENKVEEYIEFFRTNYIQRSPAQPQATPASDVVQQAQPTENLPQDEEVKEIPAAYTGPYSTDVEKPHLFVFVIPAQGVDKNMFIKGLEEFNRAGSTDGLTITEASVDEFRIAVIVNGLSDKEAAIRYSRMVIQNRALYAPLENASYRNFLISTSNFDVFLTERNIADYMEFYKQIYLIQ